MELIKLLLFTMMIGSEVTVVAGSNVSSDHSGYQVHMSRLNRYLLNDKYNRYVRPVFNRSRQTMVQMRMSLHQIIDMKEIEESIKLNVWLEIKWKDEFLTWDANEFDNIVEVHLPSRKVWIPDIFLVNSVYGTQDVTNFYSYTDVLVTPDGSVTWYSPLITTSSCTQNPGLYPFDRQTCHMRYSSWTYDKRDIDMKAKYDHVVVSELEEDGEWSIDQTKCKRNVFVYNCCPDMPYVDLEFTIRLKRKPLFYLFNLLYPCGILVLTDSMVFFLPPASGEKITLAVTVLLAMMVFLTVIMQNIPSTSLVIPLLETFFGAMIALFAVVTIEVVWVVNIYHRKSSNGRPPKWMRKFFNEKMRNIFKLPKPEEVIILRRMSIIQRENSTSKHTDDTESIEGPVGGANRLEHAHNSAPSESASSTDFVANEWQMIAQMMDYFFFSIYILLVIIVTLISFRQLFFNAEVEDL